MRNNVLVKCKGNSMRLVMKNGKTKTTASFWFGDDEIKKIRKMNTYDREIFIDIERIIVVMKYDNESCGLSVRRSAPSNLSSVSSTRSRSLMM